MNSVVTRLDDGTISLKITVPWVMVEQARVKTLDELGSQVELPGFRKGTAPRNLVAQKLGKERVDEETLKKLIPQKYIEAVTEQKLKPIVNPRVHIDAFSDGTDVVFTAETCEEPSVSLSNYKDEVKKITGTPKIITPGNPSAGSGQILSASSGQAPLNQSQNTQQQAGPVSSQAGEAQKRSLDEILLAVLSHTDVKLSKILIEQEATRLLSQMLDELKTLGLTLDQYLASRGKNAEGLRAEYEEKAKQDLKLEFVLRKIADEEKLSVSEQEIHGAIQGVKDEKQKTELTKNPYVVASIIRQQKTIDFLTKI